MVLWPRFRVGRQSGLFSSIRQAGFPERKYLEHILSFDNIISDRSDLLTADKNCSRRFRLSFSRSLPLLVITFGILQETSLSLPERLEQAKTIRSTMKPCAELYITTRNHVNRKTLYSFLHSTRLDLAGDLETLITCSSLLELGSGVWSE